MRFSSLQYNEPGVYNSGPAHPDKTAAPVAYAGGWWRLELNSELYEGVRFGFVHVRSMKQPWVITALRRVCQVRKKTPVHPIPSLGSCIVDIFYDCI